LAGAAPGGGILTGIVSRAPTLSGVSGAMPLATAISLTLTRYLRATLPNVSPDPTVWTGGVGSRVWAELPTTDLDIGMAASAGAAGSEAEVVGTATPGAETWGAAADIAVRGAAAWASFAPPPAAPVKSDVDRGAGGAYGGTDWGGGYCGAGGAYDATGCGGTGCGGTY